MLTLPPVLTHAESAGFSAGLKQLVAQQGTTRNLLSSHIAVGGDSAGGTLAAVCAIQARDAKVRLALQLLFYPGTAAHQHTASHRTDARTTSA